MKENETLKNNTYKTCTLHLTLVNNTHKFPQRVHKNNLVCKKPEVKPLKTRPLIWPTFCGSRRRVFSRT